jgi:hypothetical protein
MFRTIFPLRAAAVLALIGPWPVVAQAQSNWLDSRSGGSVNLEALKPMFKEDGFSFASSALYLSGRWAVSDAATIVAELPFAHGGFDSDFVSESDNTVGNLYLGAELRGRESRVSGALGVRLPFAADDNLATAVGLSADPVDRMEAFLPDVLSLHGAVGYEYRAPTGLAVTAQLSPILWFDVGDALVDDMELIVGYGAKIGYVGEAYAVSAGFSGRGVITEEEGSFADRTLHQLVLGASLTLDRYQPGVQLRLPLDDDVRDLVDLAIGLSFGVRFP